MKTCFRFAVFALLVAVGRLGAEERATVIVVAGAPGEEEYGKVFAQQVETWGKVAVQAGVKAVMRSNETATAPGRLAGAPRASAGTARIAAAATAT